MYKFNCVAMTTRECLNKGQRPNTVEEMKLWEGHVGPLTLIYTLENTIGEITKAYVENDSLVVEGLVEDKRFLDGSMYVAVSFKADILESEDYEYKVSTPWLYSVTPSPADTGTTPMRAM